MSDTTYYSPTGGLPPQTQLLTDRAMFREAYAVIPRGTNSDIVTSFLPFGTTPGSGCWPGRSPASPRPSRSTWSRSHGGGHERPELDPEAEGVVFVTAGCCASPWRGSAHKLDPGGYTFIPPGTDWSVRNEGSEPAHFHWIRKAYERVDGLDAPEAFVTNERDVEGGSMPGHRRKVADHPVRRPGRPAARHARHIVTFEPGAVIPFAETHVMEHGLYVLRGQGRLPAQRGLGRGPGGRLHVVAGVLPAGLLRRGPGRFRYLLYKDVNRHMKLNRRIS